MTSPSIALKDMNVELLSGRRHMDSMIQAFVDNKGMSFNATHFFAKDISYLPNEGRVPFLQQLCILSNMPNAMESCHYLSFAQIA